MSYDKDLVNRIRALLAERVDISERRMFGGLTFMLAGHMCCGVNKDELIVRLNPDDEERVLAERSARPMDFTGRRMRGFITVSPDGLRGKSLAKWVKRATDWAESLPAR